MLRTVLDVFLSLFVTLAAIFVILFVAALLGANPGDPTVTAAALIIPAILGGYMLDRAIR